MKILVISGPSGVGKGTVITKLLQDFPTKFSFAVSHTTRAQRPTETNGVHYHFVTPKTMRQMILDDKFLEHAYVHGNYYGTSEEAVEKVTSSWKTCILDIDVQGAKQVRESFPGAVLVFVKPVDEDVEVLRKRLRERGTESEVEIETRVRNAEREISECGMFDYQLVNGKDFEKCYGKLKEYLGLSGLSEKTET